MQISYHPSHDRHTNRSPRRSGGAWALLFAVGIWSFARADLIVPPNGNTSVNGGTIDLACTDVTVAGTLQLGTGSLINVRNLTIQAGGTIDGGSGTIALGGNWSNAGTFVAGTSTVQFRDLCSFAFATVAGNTGFATASFVSSVGKSYVFAVGSTQSVSGILEIAGTLAQPIAFRSSMPGQVANINLSNSGTQQIQHVGVTDVWATGQWLAPTLTNEGGGGNANRWFGAAGAATTPIPALAEAALAALAAALAALGGVALRRRELLTGGAGRRGRR
jgi:hypothetical protein